MNSLNLVLFPLLSVFPSKKFFIEALKVHDKWKYSYYDSLIISAAIFSDCKVLFSEDFHHDDEVMGLKIIDPFK